MLKKISAVFLLFVFCSNFTIAEAKIFRKEKLVKTETQLEKREFQTRIYDTKDTKIIMKAIINTLQDDGFNLSSSNTELGILTAKKEYTVKTSTGKDFAIRALYTVAFGLIGLLISNAIVQSHEYCIFASINVSEYGKQTKVRINLTENTKKDITKFQNIQDEKIYQAFFEKLDKSLFIQNEGI